MQDADRNGRDDIYARGGVAGVAGAGGLQQGPCRGHGRSRPRGCDPSPSPRPTTGFRAACGGPGPLRRNGGAPQTRAIVGGNGSTFFTDRDRLGLFLRGDGYEDVDNRIVQLDYPGEGPQKKWNITGEAIPFVCRCGDRDGFYFPVQRRLRPYDVRRTAQFGSSYDVNSNDVVWQRDYGATRPIRRLCSWRCSTP